MSTLVNLLLAIVLNLLGVQVQEHVQENQMTAMEQVEIISEEKINICKEVDSIYDLTNTLTP